MAARFDGLDAELDWAKVLSVGEQQRVAFARVLLSAPRYAILDEATSALDIANEDSLYRQLAASGTTLISVGHRPSILKYHPQVLELTGNAADGSCMRRGTTALIASGAGSPMAEAQ
jgi:putative ATP-binding cassette transporter